jgi:hypothetical protein
VITGYNTNNGVYTAKNFTLELEKQGQNLCFILVGVHLQNEPAENVIKAICWSEHYNQALWSLAMSY